MDLEPRYRNEIMKVNSCHIPPYVSFMLVTLSPFHSAECNDPVRDARRARATPGRTERGTEAEWEEPLSPLPAGLSLHSRPTRSAASRLPPAARNGMR